MKKKNKEKQIIKEIPVYTINTIKRKEQNIEDKTNLNKLCICFYKQKTLNTIYEQIKDIVNSNEFQIMYSSLNININDIVYIHYPLVYYSFKQTISFSHIEYNLEDIFNHKEKEKIKEASIEMASQYNNLIKILKTLYQNKISTSIFLTNSIHRHPSNSGFSYIDKNKSLDNPGVIYRNKKANNALQVDSVIYVKETIENKYKYYPYWTWTWTIYHEKENKDNKENKEILLSDNLVNIVNVNIEKINEEENIKGIYENIRSIALLLKDKEEEIKKEELPEDLHNTLGLIIDTNFKFTNTSELFEYAINTQIKNQGLSIEDLINKYHILTKHIKFKPYLLITYLMFDFYNKQYKNKIFINLADFEERKYEYKSLYWHHWYYPY